MWWARRKVSLQAKLCQSHIVPSQGIEVEIYRRRVRKPLQALPTRILRPYDSILVHFTMSLDFCTAYGTWSLLICTALRNSSFLCKKTLIECSSSGKSRYLYIALRSAHEHPHPVGREKRSLISALSYWCRKCASDVHWKCTLISASQYAVESC